MVPGPRTASLGAAGRIVLVVAGALLTSCGLILGVDQYQVASEPEPDAGAEARLPLLPALPDADRVSRCEACAQQHCGAERQACLESERCTAMLRCHGECSDPSCMFRCRDTEPASATFEEYFACVFGPFDRLPGIVPSPACPEKCGAGANWGCAHEYAWDRRGPGEATVQVRVRLLSTRSSVPGLDLLRHVDVAPCQEQAVAREHEASCDAPVPVDPNGTATLRLRDRRAVFSVTGGLVGDEQIRIYDRPVPRSGVLDLWAFTATTRHTTFEWLPTQGIEGLGPDERLVSFMTRDCTGVAAATGVTLEQAGGTRPVRFYWVNYGVANLVAEVGVSGGFVRTSAGPSVLRARDPRTDRLVSEYPVDVVAGWDTIVTLYPAAF
jgi:hypothetical protein